MIWGLAIAAVGCLPWLAARRFASVPVLPTAALSIVGVLYPAVLLSLLRRRRQVAAVATMGLGFLLVCVVFFGVYLPNAGFLRLSIRVAKDLTDRHVTAPGAVMMLDYKEPSLAFYQGGTIREHRAMALSAPLLDQVSPWLVITGRLWDAAPPEARFKLEEVSREQGLNLADSLRVVDVLVVRQRPIHPAAPSSGRVSTAPGKALPLAETGR